MPTHIHKLIKSEITYDISTRTLVNTTQMYSHATLGKDPNLEDDVSIPIQNNSNQCSGVQRLQFTVIACI